MIGAMNIHVSIVSIDVTAAIYPLLQTAQSKDSSGNEVFNTLLFVALPEPQANWLPPLENRAQLLTISDFLAYLMQSPRSTQGTFDARGWILRT